MLYNSCYLLLYLVGSFQQPTLSDMTMYELNFSLLVEQMLSKIVDPAYRQIMVEVGTNLLTASLFAQCQSHVPFFHSILGYIIFESCRH